MNGAPNNNSTNSNSSQGSGKNDNSSRFTTSNFVESVITPSESVFADMQKNKKRKLDQQPSPLNSNSSVMDVENFNKFDDQDEENDDDDCTLNFIEEPNLSTLTESAVSAAKTSTSFSMLTTTST